MNVPTAADQRMMALAPKIPAIFSLISSVCVLVSFYRSPEKRKKLYHRLAFVMSFYGVIQSLIYITGTFAFPYNTPFTYASKGNVSLCVIQGLLTQWTMAIPLYYTSLSIYCLVAIKEQFKQEKIVWIEKWIHGSIHIFLLVTSIFPLLTGNFNPNGPVCWIQSSPPSCGRKIKLPCRRGDGHQSYLYLLLFVGVPGFAMLITIPVMMLLIYFIQKCRDSHKTQGVSAMTVRARERKSRVVAIQATLFTLAYFGSYFMTYVNRLWMEFYGINYTLWTIGSSMIALQSFCFTLVYFGLQNKVAVPDHKARTKSYVAHLKERIEEKERMSGSIMVDNSTPKTTGRRRSFSIFDGSIKTESPWSAFLIDDDDDDDPDEESDTNSTIINLPSQENPNDPSIIQ